jgi:hypothetical protein
VQEAVDGSGYWATREGTRSGEGIAAITARGRGKEMTDPTNRASLALMDASMAVQRVVGQEDGNEARFATRQGTASAAAVTVPRSYWWVFVPDWWNTGTYVARGR